MHASVGSRKVWYERRGSGAPVVLLHGLGDSHDLWRHQLGPLGSRHDVVAVDLPGHGRSDLGDGELTVAAMADCVAGLIEALQLPSPIVVGLSMGGGVAQTIAVSRPWLPRALVLVSTSSELAPANRDRMTARATRAERDGMDAVVDETVPRWFTPEFAERELDEVARTRRTVLATAPAAFAAASRANAARNLTAELDRIRCPVLFVGGAADPADPQRSIGIFRGRISNLQTEIIANASHLVPVEAPDTFNAVLLRFMAQVESMGETPEGGGDQA